MDSTNEDAWSRLYRTGAIALMVAGSLYLLLIPALATVIARGEYLDSSQALMDQMISTPAMMWANAMIFSVIDLSALVAFPVLAFALRGVDRSWSILAIPPLAVAMVYDIQAGLIDLAIADSLADYPNAPAHVQTIYQSNVEFIFQYIYKTETPFVATMVGLSVALMSWAMLKGDVFQRWTAYLGFVVAAVAIIGGLTTFFPLLLLVGIWYVVVGLQLYRRAREFGPVLRPAEVA